MNKLDVWSVDYLSLMSRPARETNEHYWYDYEHISYPRDYFMFDCLKHQRWLEARARILERTSKLHKAYRKKKRGW